MNERFQWEDVDCNNGYSYDEFTEAELQAAWDLQGMPYIRRNEEPGSRSGRLKINLGAGDETYIGLFPNEIDAQTIEIAIEVRAALLKTSGKQLTPPSIEQIRENIRSQAW